MIRTSIASFNRFLSNRFLEVIELRLERSRVLLVFGLLLTVAAAVAIALADLTPIQRALAVLTGVGTVVFELYCRWGAAGRRRVMRAVLRADGSWELFTGAAVLVDAVLVRSWGDALGPLIALEWLCGDGISRQAWLWQGELTECLWRRLRVRLRLS